MIRSDPERPGVWVLDISQELLDALRSDWSEPVQFKVENSELIFRKVEKADD